MRQSPLHYQVLALVIMLAALILFVISFSAPPAQTACTLEARICPDGSEVGRNLSKNCEFDACPDVRPCDALTAFTICEQGEHCYKFQDEPVPICWKGDDPCRRCPSGRCAIAESFPEQIFCQ